MFNNYSVLRQLGRFNQSTAFAWFQTWKYIFSQISCCKRRPIDANHYHVIHFFVGVIEVHLTKTSTTVSRGDRKVLPTNWSMTANLTNNNTITAFENIVQSQQRHDRQQQNVCTLLQYNSHQIEPSPVDLGPSYLIRTTNCRWKTLFKFIMQSLITRTA